jgi:SNF2-related domain
MTSSKRNLSTRQRRRIATVAGELNSGSRLRRAILRLPGFLLSWWVRLGGSASDVGPSSNGDGPESLETSLTPPKCGTAQTASRLPHALFPYQLEGIGALVQSDRLLLADDMGLGKTVQAIVALRLLAQKGECRRALVVTPAGLLGQWRRELSVWAPDLSVIIVRGPQEDRGWQWRADPVVTLVGYETLRSDSAGGDASPPMRRLWGVLVLDEAPENQESRCRGEPAG